MRGTILISTILIAGALLVATFALAEALPSQDYLHDCAECHGADGRGAQAAKRAVPGYISIDLTQISKRNGGTFPRQKVEDAIDGRSRIKAHFHGDMPRWGARYRIDQNNQGVSEEQVRDRIKGLVDFIESIQEK